MAVSFSTNNNERDELLKQWRRWSTYEIGKDGKEYVRAPEFSGCWVELNAYADYVLAIRHRQDDRFAALNARRRAQGKRPICRGQYLCRVRRFDEFRKAELCDCNIAQFETLMRKAGYRI